MRINRIWVTSKCQVWTRRENKIQGREKKSEVHSVFVEEEGWTRYLGLTYYCSELHHGGIGWVVPRPPVQNHINYQKHLLYFFYSYETYGVKVGDIVHNNWYDPQQYSFHLFHIPLSVSNIHFEDEKVNKLWESYQCENVEHLFTWLKDDLRLFLSQYTRGPTGIPTWCFKSITTTDMLRTVDLRHVTFYIIQLRVNY